ncbi:Fructose-bisphosphate aldolase class 1 [Nocardioides dokdonensis FR1436]|uniref:Probable fructose-bisphosphate aldolase class 1 n=1 Tax=Nocardioides dokdonensis FR1436 TaxID=1300347 RepID=A0A1A9GLN8_9ACTN|nr:class I fructose-bisphosphate aldolase [Nocardioides dokdonensis]ANH39184.1 Fructose-bisphosphate aldolase class 1 [Nocardioides dokdonensis FR1436]
MATSTPSTTPASTLSGTAQALVAPGKGILAADESLPTMVKRLARIGVESTEDTRRSYRELLFTTPGLADTVSGVILFDETMRQRSSTGAFLPEILAGAGILPGIKVDAGTVPLAGAPGELVTQGLDGLRERFAEYAALGARFAKWRAVLRVGPLLPSSACVEANAHALARYAALAQDAGLVPIVEPEVLMDGSHGTERCAEVTRQVLRQVYAELARQHVDLASTLLKPSMVLPGTTSPEAEQVSDDEVAARTIAVLRDTVPASVPGVVFLSGGQSPQQATARLDALNRLGVHQPWQLSFSFGRALQAPVLDAWRGEPENVAPAQAVLAERARLTGAARRGCYERTEEPAVPEPLGPGAGG